MEAECLPFVTVRGEERRGEEVVSARWICLIESNLDGEYPSFPKFWGFKVAFDAKQGQKIK